MNSFLDKISRWTDPYFAKNYIEDDLLFDLNKIPNIIVEWKGGWPTLIFFFLFLTMEQVLAVYYFFSTKNTIQYDDVYKIYLSVGVGSLIGTAGYYTLIIVNGDFHKIVDDLFPKCVPFDFVGLKNYNTLRTYAFYARIFVVLSIGVTMISVLLSLPWFGDEHNIYYPIIYFNDLLGEKWGKFAIFLMYVSMGHVGWTVLADAHGLLYLVLHLHFQMFILNKRLERLAEEAANWDEATVEVEEIQQRIAVELKSCMNHHLLTMELAQRINALIYYPIYVFTIFGIVAMVVTVYIYKYIQNAPWTTKLRNVCTLLCASFITSAFVFCGQVMEDESALLIEMLYNLPWVLFNPANKRTIMIMRGNSYQAMTLSSSGIITLNYRLFIVLFKAVNSAVAFLVSMDKRNKAKLN